MPDLTPETYYICESAEQAVLLEPSDTGAATYTVTYDRVHHFKALEVFLSGGSLGEIELDWACTCKAYRFGAGKHCKHIERARRRWCGWNSLINDGSPQETAEGLKCPKCNCPAIAQVQMV